MASLFKVSLCPFVRVHPIQNIFCSAPLFVYSCHFCSLPPSMRCIPLSSLSLSFSAVHLFLSPIHHPSPPSFPWMGYSKSHAHFIFKHIYPCKKYEYPTPNPTLTTDTQPTTIRQNQGHTCAQ